MSSIASVSDLLQFLGESHCFVREASSPPWYRSSPNFWFRGQCQADWELQPQVLRPEFGDHARKLELNVPDPNFSFEASLFNQLLRRGHALLDGVGTPTDQYFIAQHYGLPTRLLDWSTNPLVALFFAAEHSHSSNDDHSAGSLFVMRSRHSISRYEEQDIVYMEHEEISDFVASLTRRALVPSKTSALPLRIMPNLHAGRMLQQDSRFTLHLPGCQSLESVQTPGFLQRLDVPHSAKERLREELRVLGVHWGTLFVDLPNVIKQIRSEAGA